MGIDLSKVTTEVKSESPGIIIYSLADGGKSTFIANMVRDVPNSILFQCGESSLANLKEEDKKDVPHYPDILGGGTTSEDLIANYFDFCKLLTQLDDGECPYSLIAFDNMDNIINKNLTEYVINEYYEGDVAKAGGWGNKKVVEIVHQTNRIIEILSSLRNKGVTIVLSFHSRVIPIEDPLGNEYSMFTFNLPANSRGSVRELFVNWGTQIMFGSMDVTSVKSNNKKKRATGGDRVLMCGLHPAYEVKNKFQLPDKISFDYETFKAHVSGEVEKPEKKAKNK